MMNIAMGAALIRSKRVMLLWLPLLLALLSGAVKGGGVAGYFRNYAEWNFVGMVALFILTYLLWLGLVGLSLVLFWTKTD